MLHAGLDLSRRWLDVCLLSEHGELVAQNAAPPDADGLRGLADRVGRYRQPVRAVIESMNGARFVHDTLEELGWEVLVADAKKVKGLAPLACKTDKSTLKSWPCCRSAIWCRRSGCPTRASGASASWRASGCTWCGTARR
jgi:transposase